MTNEGNKLSKEYLISRGFVKEVIEAEYPGDDEEIMFIKDGITIYWDQWGSENPFAFTTYVRSDGRYKGGFTIFTEEQLMNLYYSLVNQVLYEVGSQGDIEQRIEYKEREIESYKQRKLRYPKDEACQDHCDRMIIETQSELEKLKTV